MRSCRNENKTKQKQNPKSEEEEKIKSAARRYNSFKNKNSGIVIKYKHSLQAIQKNPIIPKGS